MMFSKIRIDRTFKEHDKIYLDIVIDNYYNMLKNNAQLIKQSVPSIINVLVSDKDKSVLLLIDKGTFMMTLDALIYMEKSYLEAQKSTFTELFRRGINGGF